MTAKDMFSHRVSILTGHYGTGKTEVSVNLALALAACQGANPGPEQYGIFRM